ncbi:diguanylate cyclase [Methylomonas sp. LWB]|uniref:GGDEF domain-containing protein n=1 Tax=Methylomonas sp. LWB TaxID=1905845 RepID=UPI0008D91F7D|nr:DUF484 family protein [Methylomonas sp. LWB]OHX37276.1 diguanylate cyclase [Methylomonas sp. LWB]
MEEDITAELSVLESHLDGMLNRVQHNSLTLKRLQAFEMRLLALNTLAEMIEFIIDETRLFFNLDAVCLSLIDAQSEIASCLEADHYAFRERPDLVLLEQDGVFLQSFGTAGQPLVGIHRDERWSRFFPGVEKQPASVVIIPLIRRGKILGSLNLGSHQRDRFINGMATDFIEHIASVIGICLENNLNVETMRRTSLIDPLTGVNNRRFLEQRIVEELDRSQRSREPLSCLFLDIDYFKRINDGFGHQAGDQVLSLVACTIKRQLRSNDVLVRYGGEEFVALLSQADETMNGEIAERIRIGISDLTIKYADQVIPVTISIGAATYHPNLSRKLAVPQIALELVQAADVALYEAKRSGRNRVENAGLVLEPRAVQS